MKIQEMAQELPKFECLAEYIFKRRHLRDFHSPETSGVVGLIRFHDWYCVQPSLSAVLLTEHAHEDLVDPGEDADDVEGGEGDVQEEPDPDL